MTAEAISRYLHGIELLRESVSGMTRQQVFAYPVPGKWSTMQVICHIADFEPIYADRIKRVIAEESPILISGDPDLFASRLCYTDRDPEEELTLIEMTRRQLARILTIQPESSFQRVGQHSVDGEITLETLLVRVTNHIPHHVAFINEKRIAMGLPPVA